MSTATATNGNRIATIAPTPSPTTDETRSISPFASEGNFVAAQRVATALGQSSLVPKQYQGRENLPNVLIALELAARIGASPLMVMQNLYIVQGKPSWSSSFLIACVNQSHRFTPLRFRWEGKPGTDDWGCRAVASDKDTGEECLGSLITIRLAKAEGWHGKNGSKWQTMPEQMLMYRAAGFWSRVYAPELSLGMLTAEEATDISAPPATAITNAGIDAEILGEAKPVEAKVEEVATDEPKVEAKTDPEPDLDQQDALDSKAQDFLEAIGDAISELGLKKIETEINAAEAKLGEQRTTLLRAKLAEARAAIVAKKK